MGKNGLATRGAGTRSRGVGKTIRGWLAITAFLPVCCAPVAQGGASASTPFGTAAGTARVVRAANANALELGGSSRTFTAAAATGKELAVTANVSWTAKSSASWLALKTASGTGNGKIVYNVAANAGTGSRTGKITVAGGGKTATYTVSQSGKTVELALGGSNRTFTAAAASSKELAVTANVSWTAKSSASWLALKTAGGTGNGKIVYNVAVNAGTGSRTGKITVAGGGKTATYTVSQAGSPPGAGTNKYAVCVGINKYADISSLSGCVNDSKYMEWNLVAAGWPSANVKRLNDSQATKNAIRKAISNVAAKAVSGDTFVFQQSSHGGQSNADPDDPDGEPLTGSSGKAVYLCVYDEDSYDHKTAYNDYELAADLASFRSGVKVVVIVDACHSGGLFKSATKARAAASTFDIAERVSALMDNNRAARRARGEKIEKGISSSEIGWVTAAEYHEYSQDGGFYHTDKWLTDSTYGDGYFQYPSSWKVGGVFLTSATWGLWNGTADGNATAGDNDGYCDAYEFWREGYEFCVDLGSFWGADYAFHPQCLNTGVLRSVKLGKSGAALELGGSSRTFTAAAATGKELAVTGNVSWKAISSVPWLTLKTTGGTGNGKIVYNVAANAGPGERTGEIAVSGGGTTRTYTVTQNGTGWVREAGATRAGNKSKAAPHGAGRVWVTTSDGRPGEAVADGDEETGWTPEGTGGAWVALTFEEPRSIGGVVVKGTALPEGLRALVSEDGDDWSEEGSDAASYLWVVLPDEGETPTITEIESEP